MQSRELTSTSGSPRNNPLVRLSREDVHNQFPDLSSQGWRIADDQSSLSQKFQFKDFVSHCPPYLSLIAANGLNEECSLWFHDEVRVAAAFQNDWYGY